MEVLASDNIVVIYGWYAQTTNFKPLVTNILHYFAI